jgi:hypothetical protein
MEGGRNGPRFFVKQKQRGRPETGLDLFVGIRLTEPVLAGIAGWLERRDAASRSEAIRRLVEIGHRFDGQQRPFVASRAQHAEKLAGAQIDKMSDASATGEERTEVPTDKRTDQFRQGRLDQPRKERFR